MNCWTISAASRHYIRKLRLNMEHPPSSAQPSIHICEVPFFRVAPARSPNCLPVLRKRACSDRRSYSGEHSHRALCLEIESWGGPRRVLAPARRLRAVFSRSGGGWLAGSRIAIAHIVQVRVGMRGAVRGTCRRSIRIWAWTAPRGRAEEPAQGSTHGLGCIVATWPSLQPTIHHPTACPRRLEQPVRPHASRTVAIGGKEAGA